MNEFSYLVAADAVGRTGDIRLTADAAARAAVTERLRIVSVDRFAVTAKLEHGAKGVELTGTIDADVVQACAATDLPLAVHVAAPFALRYVAELELPQEADAELELDDGDCDTLLLEPGGIDIGEAAVQTLALALDAFPRHPDADRILAERGVLKEEQAGPFAALAALKRG